MQPEEIYIDDIGVGRGCTDRLLELGYRVNGVSVGERPYDLTKYKNIKAENFWNASLWLKAQKDGKPVNKLLKDDRWQQAAWIKYKVSTDKVLQIEPKEDLKERTGKSPDFYEAFSLIDYNGCSTMNFILIAILIHVYLREFQNGTFHSLPR